MQIKGIKIHPVLLIIGGVIIVALLVAGVGLLGVGDVPSLDLPVGESFSSGRGASGLFLPSPGSGGIGPSSFSSGYYFGLGDLLELIFLSPISWIIAIGLAVWFVRRSRRAAEHSEHHKGLLERVSPVSALLASILTLALIILFSRIWIDLADVVSAGSRPLSANEQLAALFTHTLFVSVVLVVAFLLYFAMKERMKQFTAIVMPYFVSSLIFAAWLLLDTAIFAFSNLGSFGIYAILFFVVLLFSVLLYFSQDWEHKRHLAVSGEGSHGHDADSGKKQ